MPRSQFSALGTMAAIGVIWFLIVNGWSTLTGRPETDAIVETRPTVSKQAAASAAEQYAARLPGGGPVRSGLVVYQSDKLLSGYVQKEHLVADYRSQYAKHVPIDFYRVELEPADGGRVGYFVDVNMTSGEVIGWQKRSDGPAPSVRDGRAIAEAYLRQAGVPLESLQMLLPNKQAPYQFAFEHRGGVLGEAKWREIVEIRGEEVTAYRTELLVPSSHIEWVERQDRAAAAMTQLNMILSGLMGIAAVVAMIARRKQIAFVRGIWLTLTFLVLYWINNFNMLPAFQALEAPGFDPFLSSDASFGMVVLMNVIVGAMGVVGYFSLAAGQPLWQDRGLHVWSRWREETFGADTLNGMKRGYLLACLMLGVQALLFFIAEQRFDMWSVNDPSGSMYNLLKPQLFPLMAWTAAISEEAIYRFFGIAIFQRLFGATFPAVLVTSVIWAFSHTQYPIYPVYTRLVEVTVLGLIFGYAFLKFGFATVLFAHAVMDSLLMSFSLMNLGGAADIALGLFYIVLPAIVAWIIWLLHRARRRPPVSTAF